MLKELWKSVKGMAQDTFFQVVEDVRLHHEHSSAGYLIVEAAEDFTKRIKSTFSFGNREGSKQTLDL